MLPGYMVTFPDVRGITVVIYSRGYMVTSHDARGMVQVNFYQGYIVTSPDVRGMTIKSLLPRKHGHFF